MVPDIGNTYKVFPISGTHSYIEKILVPGAGCRVPGAGVPDAGLELPGAGHWEHPPQSQ